MDHVSRLIPARLVARYKRFLADVRPEGAAGDAVMTVHCPNTGSMRNCVFPGERVWLSEVHDARRKYPHTWELAETPEGDLIGVNTHRANALVAEAIAEGRVETLLGYGSCRREVRYGTSSRVDFLLEDGADGRPCYVEVKSVTLHEGNGRGRFPDAVSARGARHLAELARVVRDGARGLLLYCVQHTGIEHVAVAADIDPDYACAFDAALAAGVEVVALGAAIDLEGMALCRQLPVG